MIPLPVITLNFFYLCASFSEVWRSSKNDWLVVLQANVTVMSKHCKIMPQLKISLSILKPPTRDPTSRFTPSAENGVHLLCHIKIWCQPTPTIPPFHCWIWTFHRMCRWKRKHKIQPALTVNCLVIATMRIRLRSRNVLDFKTWGFKNENSPRRIL